MVNCQECGKKLGIFKGYHHPALGKGKRFLLCGECFDRISKDMQRWNNYCVSDLFNVESSKVDIQHSWNTSISNDLPLQKWFSNLWTELGSIPIVE